ncbi:MAG: DUF362 domain-containing protein [Candidatus Hodarchaeales archaeon]
MSFFLDPPLLFILGILILIFKLRFQLSGQQIRILGFLATSTVIIISGLLYFEFLDWPLNFFDWSAPIFESVNGKIWMLHSDITGISDISIVVVIFLFSLYPFWLFLGYEVSRAIFDPHALYILAGGPYVREDVKSQKRVRKPTDELLYAVVRNSNHKEALSEAIMKIGGINQFIQENDNVVIKVNICGGNPLVEGSFTSIVLTEEIVKLIRNAGGNPVVVDSDMIWTDFEPVAEAQGWLKWSQDNQIPLINLRKTHCVKFHFGESSVVKENIVSKLLMDADVIISIPTMKTHLLTNVTLGMKNMYGTFPTGEKAQYHDVSIEDVIVDINTAFTPTLTIIDGSIGGESIGPLTCSPVYSNIIIISNDVVTADAVASKIMGYNPLTEIEHLNKAHELGIGNADVSFELTQIEGGPHGKDGNWIRPDPEVSKFYNDVIESFLDVPGAKKFINAAADFALYDTATLPIFENITPLLLGTTSDVLASIFGVLYSNPKGGRKKKIIAEKIGEKSEKSELFYPKEDLKNEIEKIQAIKTINQTLLSLIIIFSAFLGFVIGGFWDKTLDIINNQPNTISLILFLIGLGITGVGILLYGPKIEVKVLASLAVVAAILALINEFLFSEFGYLTYLDGDLISLSFAVLGYPLFVVFIVGLSDWIVKYVRLPEHENLLFNSLPIIGIFLVSLILIAFEGFLTLLLTSDVIIIISTILILIIFTILSFYFGFTHTFKQNLILVINSVILGAFMEILGNIIGFWSYDVPEVPLFIILLWAFRVLTIGGILSLMQLKILRYGHREFVIKYFQTKENE